MNEQKPPNDFTGLWVYECPTGMTYETEYVQGIKHGVYRHIHKSGAALREGVKCNGLDHGLVTLRNTENKILDSYQLEHGTGTHLIYNSQGNIGWVIPYKNGQQHGTKRQYSNNVVVSEEEWSNGKRI